MSEEASMTGEATNEVKRLAKGVYHPASASDVRSPCPMINCLANHGYLHRDGRDITSHDLYSAVRTAGLAISTAALFSKTALLEHQNPDAPTATPTKSLLETVWSFVRDPFATILSRFGTRPANQVNDKGEPVVNLDDLARHNAIEHDISLTRYDYAQGNNCSPREHLILDLLASSSDGGQTLTMQDLTSFRRQRIRTQRRENKLLDYGKLHEELGCGEIALMLQVLGDGKRVRCDFIRAFLMEERLPLDEGWVGRKWWWSLGLLELKMSTNKVKEIMAQDG